MSFAIADWENVQEIITSLIYSTFYRYDYIKRWIFKMKTEAVYRLDD